MQDENTNDMLDALIDTIDEIPTIENYNMPEELGINSRLTHSDITCTSCRRPDGTYILVTTTIDEITNTYVSSSLSVPKLRVYGQTKNASIVNFLEEYEKIK